MLNKKHNIHQWEVQEIDLVKNLPLTIIMEMLQTINQPVLKAIQLNILKNRIFDKILGQLSPISKNKNNKFLKTIY